jgi:hypothetical protein
VTDSFIPLPQAVSYLILNLLSCIVYNTDLWTLLLLQSGEKRPNRQWYKISAAETIRKKGHIANKYLIDKKVLCERFWTIEIK